MSEFTCSRELGESPEEVFDVVADVERYPEFVPGCRAARILQRDGNRLLVEQQLGVGKWTWRFRTDAELERPQSIRITSRETPFEYLDQQWRFSERARGGTHVALAVRYELRNPALRAFATGLFDEAFRRTVRAFEERLRARRR